MHRRKTAAVALAATAVLFAGTGTALADTSTAAPASAPAAASAKAAKGDGARALCKRAPKIDKHIDRALTRLNGSAGTRGSISRLEKRVAKAKAAGHTAIATFLNDRLAHRKPLVPRLEKAKNDLAKVESWCQANNGGTAT